MHHKLTDYLPDVLPYGEVKTTDSFTYNVYETETGPVPETEFTLSKAPINRVKSVTATIGGNKQELAEGVDYELREDDYIELLDGGVRPDDGAELEVTYYAESIISRYAETIDEQVEARDESIDTVVANKYISSADGDALDEIGKLFGDLGQRAGRDNERYRRYLSSIAEVYSGRGTKESVAKAVATVVSSETNTITTDEISYREFFDTNEYNIRFEDFESHRVSLLYDIAEIADPSGVKFIGPIYDTGTTSAHIDEGPPVDPEDFEKFDTIEDVPDSYIDPIGPKYLIDLDVDIFGDTVTEEHQPPWYFEWAHQKTSSVSGADGDSWNQFQWSDGTWDSPGSIETEITGDLSPARWEFSDWNRIAPQAESTVAVSDDGPTIDESVSVDITDL